MTIAASGIVLAGGSSRRLGQDKRSVRLESSQTLLDQTISRVGSVVDDVIVVVATSLQGLADDRVRVVFDDISGRGPLGGIVAGLRATKHDRAMIVACDLPFLSPAALRLMLDVPTSSDLLVPRREDGTLEMLHAVYRRPCVDTAARLLEVGQYRMAGLVPALIEDGLQVGFLGDDFFRSVDPELLTFFNVNTAEDLERARIRASALAERELPGDGCL